MTENSSWQDVTQYTLDDALKALREGDNKSAALSYGLSGLRGGDKVKFGEFWKELDIGQKRDLLAYLIDVNESNFEFDYNVIGYLALEHSSDATIRQSGIEILWEDESISLLEKLMHIARWDSSQEVRAVALSALGRFILLGEYGKLPETYTKKAHNVAIEVWNSADEENNVRRRALEALSNSSHESLTEFINEAYHSSDHDMIVGAVYSMGRSCDEQWSKTVLKELSNVDPEIRFEAVRASGELEIEPAVKSLGRLAATDEREIREAAVWSLGEIGGQTALEILGKLLPEDGDDEGWEELVEDAIANANLSLGILSGLDLDDE